MDTRNMYMEIYGSGCVMGNAYSVPAWAKSGRLEYSVPLAEIWRMGESAVAKNVAMVGSLKPGDNGGESGGIMGMMGSVFDVVKQVANTSMINAEKHIM